MKLQKKIRKFVVIKHLSQVRQREEKLKEENSMNI